MEPFNRERFLFLLLAAVMGANALFFAYGLFACSRSEQPHLVCPDLGNRFDNYSEKALAAVLGLIAGAGAITLSQRSSSDDPSSSQPSPGLVVRRPRGQDSVRDSAPGLARGLVQESESGSESRRGSSRKES